MKINLTIDATPEEVRRVLGLPVMNDVHQAVMDQMSDQVKKGTVDPEKVMEMLGPSMKAGQQIMETFLKGMGSAMETASTMEEDSKKKSPLNKSHQNLMMDPKGGKQEFAELYIS